MEKKYVIYSYEVDTYVYVGLTNNILRRDKEHRKSSDTIASFCQERNIEIPSPKLLEENLSSIEAQSKEHNWIDYYSSQGFTVLNKVATGIYVSSIGNAVNNNPEKRYSKITRLQDIEAKIKNGTLLPEEATSQFWRYATKTQMSKQNPQLYSYCRNNDLLKLFPKKHDKKKSPVKKEYLSYCNKFSNSDISWEGLIEIPNYPNFYLDTKNHKIYRKMKISAKELSPLKKEGYVCYTLFNGNYKINHTFPYHYFYGLTKGYKNFYIKYKDGDIENLSSDNLEIIDITNVPCSQIHEKNGYWILRNGLIYNSKMYTAMYGNHKGERGWCFDQYTVDELVYNFHIFPIDYGIYTITHKDNNIWNNNVDNLICKEIGSIAKIKCYNTEDGYQIFIVGKHNSQYVAKTKDEYIASQISSALEKRLEHDNDCRNWLEDFINNEVPSFIEQAIKREKDKLRTESSGCYWHAARDCWKSKIWYGDKEWSLGYFKTFEEGKFLYEEACIAIKFNVFETWYGMIEKEREKVKKIFSC